MNALSTPTDDLSAIAQTRHTRDATLVFAGERVYRIKRPLREGARDYSTLARRRFCCFEEVRLNRRLAADVYLGVVPLVQADDGHLRVGGSGTPVEWAVAMRRLDATCRLDRRLAEGSVSENDALCLAARLAAFHRAQPRAGIDATIYQAMLRQRLRAAAARHGEGEAAALIGQLEHWLLRHPQRFAARVAAGRVIEAHGDLRPERVWLGDGLRITGSLEYAIDLRLLDSADELALFLLGCERLGARDVGAAVWQAYGRLSGDAVPTDLMHFHQALRALSSADPAQALPSVARDHVDQL